MTATAVLRGHADAGARRWRVRAISFWDEWGPMRGARQPPRRARDDLPFVRGWWSGAFCPNLTASYDPDHPSDRAFVDPPSGPPCVWVRKGSDGRPDALMDEADLGTAGSDRVVPGLPLLQSVRRFWSLVLRATDRLGSIDRDILRSTDFID